MVKSYSEIWNDPHFTLKLFVIVLGVLNTLILHDLKECPITLGYHCSMLMVMAVLMISTVFFETTVMAEVSLLVATLIKLTVTLAYCTHIACGWGYFPQAFPDLRRISIHWIDTHKESYKYEYYAFWVNSVTCMILICIDIVLRFFGGSKN